MTQPTALELADALEQMSACNYDTTLDFAAAKLRRLHAANIDCLLHFKTLKADFAALEAVARRALEALDQVVAAADGKGWAQLDPALTAQRQAITAGRKVLGDKA